MTRLAIAGGGTGGHLFPALAVAEALVEQGVARSEILFVGSERGLEQRLVGRHGFPLECLPARPFQGQGGRARLAAVAALPGLVVAARHLLARFAPDGLLGVGGYASVPAGLAARSLGVRLVLQEQNRWPGLANRLLAHFARRVCVVDDAVARFFPGGRCVATGNPVPGERRQAGSPAEVGLKEGCFTLLVIGGSGGAVALNEVLAAAAPLLADRAGDLQILHACGDHPTGGLEEAYAKAGIHARVLPFIERMGVAYAVANAIVARAGALTCQEIANAGLPSLLIPYPYATHDHQWHNALRLQEVGAAQVVRQGELDPARLAATIRAWLDDPAGRARQAAAAHRLAAPDAATKVAAELLAAAAR
ncbi:MAG: undecaprenyldiphospho-muramoylpentapeptide beta-N-acetylglucosaminyltransferase [Nitrospirae bacterium CG18_big_fil_WC_8_21_14_2_50_70_55]|nr:undecaprenyldiphospho-muramoylpentapeptide beta-N-acetylglucosaminyltransferase [Deltaproteobacteria bacterium]OIP65814.1 MAG: undecaprenyldiphospho-muramoylpentapeptide beta-N-acetylglucosaminyltransferase [Nitrospirae bacterium CG2_30_70_394]PIQ04060.1 MAG: undecaprenyldiphospho-muramoylpentapeptide beta-N-acetylglucosaminyltransferase [Nitrospirae bacterium CG18_big_fil_WC_8_21_14_2_50_70_55]PIU77227.1 MAG: undecaprenyldiphospho-muramoylpentapeptide beta-N-acetylglucosaminyltransferase [Ni